MKNIFIYSLVVVFFSIPNFGKDKASSLFLGPQVEYFHYNEPNIMSEKGALYGINGKYIVTQSPLFYTDFRYLRGTLLYDGALLSIDGTTTPYKDFSTHELFQGELLWGKDIHNKNKDTLQGIVGLGYRLWVDHLDEIDTGGYKRRTSYLYIPIGIQSDININSNWSITYQLRFNALLEGKNTSHTKKLGYDSNLQFTQKKGHGLTLNLSFIKTLNNKKTITISPYFQYWNIKDSSQDKLYKNGTFVNTVIEPKNATHEIGLICSFPL